MFNILNPQWEVKKTPGCFLKTHNVCHVLSTMVNAIKP